MTLIKQLPIMTRFILIITKECNKIILLFDFLYQLIKSWSHRCLTVVEIKENLIKIEDENKVFFLLQEEKDKTIWSKIRN